MIFSNGVYNKLKFLAQIVLPALGTLYAAVSGYWKWPNTEEVVGTIIAVDFFLGTLLGLSSRSYNSSSAKYDGAFEVTENEDGDKLMTLNFERNPDALRYKKEVLLKVDLADEAKP